MAIQVNKRFLPLKAHYFFFNAGTAPVVPFIPTLIKQLGFSPVVLGLVYTVLPIVSILTKPVFGIIADKFRRQKLLFLVFQVFTALGFFLIYFIPSITKETKVQLDCNDGISQFKYCQSSNESFNECTVTGLLNITDDSVMECKANCYIDPERWDEKCQNWKIQEDCTVAREYVDFTAYSPRKHFTNTSTCLFFRVDRVQFDQRNSSLFCSYEEKYFETDCVISCNDSKVTELISPGITNKMAYGLYQFWLLFILMIISWGGMAVVVSVGDAICFEMLGDKPQLYGNQRLWGAVGWGTFSLIAGLLVDRFSSGKVEKDYTVVFFMTLILIGFDILVSSKLKHTQAAPSKTFFSDLRQLFSSVRPIVFFLWCVSVGLGTSLVWNFLFWHLEELGSAQAGCNQMEWIKTLEGIVMAIQCFGGELPFFFLSGYILKKIGHVNAMTLVLAAFGVRFLLYSIITNPWQALPIEFLQGITFGLFYATMASYASIVAPEGTEATMQGVVGAIFEGVGVATGSFIGGHAFLNFGGSKTFRYFGNAAIGLSIIHFLVQTQLKPVATPPKRVYELTEDLKGTNSTLNEMYEPTNGKS